MDLDILMYLNIFISLQDQNIAAAKRRKKVLTFEWEI